MTFKKHVRLFPETRTCFFKKTYVLCVKSVYLPQEMGKKTIPFILITKTYKHYGEIYQSLHRFRLSPDIRAGGTQGVTNRFPEPIVLRREPDECENYFERWIYLLKHMDTLERMPFKAKKAVFDKLLEVADVANLSKEERIQYDEALKRYWDYKNTIHYAEEKGILKGKESTARNMKADGLSHSNIHKYTGLSLEDIEKL